MQRVLRKRILRDLKVNFFRYFALGLLIVMAMFLVVTIVGNGENLTRGTVKIAEETNLEDGEFKVFVPLTKEQISDIEKMDVKVSEQFYLDYVMENEDKSVLRIFKVRKNINKMHYTQGNEPSKAGDIALEKRFCETQNIKTGDKINISGKEYNVVGIGCVSDYEAPYKELSDTSCNSKYFGMAFMTDEDYENFEKEGKAEKTEEYSYAYSLGKGVSNKKLKNYLNDIKIDADEVDDKYFKEYWEDTGGVEEDLRDAIKDLREATDDVSEGLAKLDKHSDDISDASAKLFESYLKQANSSLEESGMDVHLTEKNFENELDRLIDESDEPMVRLSLRSAKSELVDLKKYKDGVKDYTKGVGKLSDGTGEMADGEEELDDATDEALDEFDFSLSNLTLFVKRADNPRIFATKTDKEVDIMAGLVAGAFLLVLMAYVISVFVVHSIEKESSIIGTLYSMGVTKNDLILHYISLPVVVTVVSGLGGGLLAATGILVPMVADSSYQYFSIPYFEFEVPKYLWIYCGVIPPFISVIVNTIIINSKLGRPALSLIRNEKKQNKIRKIDLGKMNFVAAFRIRQMLREFRSGLAVIFGMLLALLVFMLASNSYIYCSAIPKDYGADTKYEYMYTLKYPEKEVPEGAAPAYAYTCKKSDMGCNFDVTMLGLEKGNPYFDVNTTKSKEKVAVSSAFAQKFRLNVGDEFVVTDEEKEVKYAFTVDSIANYSTGFYIFMNIDTMRDMFDKSDDYYNVLFSDKELDVEAGRLCSTITKDDIVMGAGVFVNIMMSMVYMLIIASVAIFCVVMYLMMKVMIDRSALNISLIKVFGYRRKEIKKLYLDGNFFIVAIGGAICVPLAKIIMNEIFPLMVSNVNCGIHLDAPFYFYIIVYAVIILLYFIINALLVKNLDKYTPAEVLKNRE